MLCSLQYLRSQQLCELIPFYPITDPSSTPVFCSNWHFKRPYFLSFCMERCSCWRHRAGEFALFTKSSVWWGEIATETSKFFTSVWIRSNFVWNLTVSSFWLTLFNICPIARYHVSVPVMPLVDIYAIEAPVLDVVALNQLMIASVVMSMGEPHRRRWVHCVIVYCVMLGVLTMMQTSVMVVETLLYGPWFSIKCAFEPISFAFV